MIIFFNYLNILYILKYYDTFPIKISKNCNPNQCCQNRDPDRRIVRSYDSDNQNQSESYSESQIVLIYIESRRIVIGSVGSCRIVRSYNFLQICEIRDSILQVNENICGRFVIYQRIAAFNFNFLTIFASKSQKSSYSSPLLSYLC